MTELYASCATAEITPPLGIAMGGYWERNCVAKGVRDALWAKALVFSCAGQSCALVALDLVALQSECVRRIRARIAVEVGIAADAVMICASHTHAGPLTLAFRGMGSLDSRYIESVEDAVVETVRRAQGRLQVATLRYARAPVQIGRNRRGRTDGAPMIPYAHAVAIEGVDECLAVLFSHACHPVVLGVTNCELSADFVGAAARYIEEQICSPALFVNGACGDINPRRVDGGTDAVEVLGVELGTAIVRALAEAEPLVANRLARGSKCLHLPLVPPLAHWRAQLEYIVLKVKAVYRQVLGKDAGITRAARARLRWIQDVLADGGGEGEMQPFLIQALAVGPLLLLGMEGEIFARYQLEIEAGSETPIILCGYANGCIGYVPTADEYERGGYEIDEAYKVYPSVRMIAPESEALIRGAVAELVVECVR